MDDTYLRSLFAEWPPIIARKNVFAITGGLISPTTLRSEDSKGKGPTVRLISSFGVSYPREALFTWLLSRGLTIYRETE